MKSTLYCLLALILITSCSSPKYAYNFDYYDYNGAKKTQKSLVAHVEEEKAIDPKTLLASSENAILITEFEYGENQKEIAPSTEIRKTYLQMTKSERREFRSEVKKFLKEKKDVVKAAKKANAMDNDLKLAAIFGAVGVVALIISGDVFYIIGGIAMIIGVVFFVKWLVRQ